MSKINLNYYKEDLDKSVYFGLKNLNENVLKLLKDADDPDVFKKLPIEVRYFINPKKENLLNWYEFKPEDDVLIINDPLGVITKSICDKVHSVSLVEFSKSLAEITNERLSNKENVEIYVGDPFGITFTTNYDYVISIDIMESQNPFYNFKDPFREFFEYIEYFLKPEGKLVLSVNNLFGLKNWNGAFDEITGNCFQNFGSNLMMQSSLFTKRDYAKMLEFLGYDDVMFNYPIPNQYSPDLVVTESEAKDDSLAEYFKNYALSGEKLFNETHIIDDIIKNDKLYLFANSFLIFASKEVVGDISW